MRLKVCLIGLFFLACLASGCAGKRKASIEGHVKNLGVVDQSGIVVQLARNEEIITQATTGSEGGYSIDQIDPGDYEAYIRDNDPGPGSFDSLKSSTRVRWRRSPSVFFPAEGGLVAYPADLTRYTLLQAKLSSGDTLAGFVFDRAVNGLASLVTIEDSADIFVKLYGMFGVEFGTTGRQSIADLGLESLEVASDVPGSGYQEHYSFNNISDCTGKNYCIRCRCGRYAKIHVFDAGDESPWDSLAIPYVTFLGFCPLDDTATFPAIPPE